MKADKDTVLQLLKTAKGQIDGIIKMVENDRYCIDISHQVMAAEAVLQKVNREILTAHLKHCVKDASDPTEKDQKVDELIALLSKILQ